MDWIKYFMSVEATLQEHFQACGALFPISPQKNRTSALSLSCSAVSINNILQPSLFTGIQGLFVVVAILGQHLYGELLCTKKVGFENTDANANGKKENRIP